MLYDIKTIEGGRLPHNFLPHQCYDERAIIDLMVFSDSQVAIEDIIFNMCRLQRKIWHIAWPQFVNYHEIAALKPVRLVFSRMYSVLRNGCILFCVISDSSQFFDFLCFS